MQHKLFICLFFVFSCCGMQRGGSFSSDEGKFEEVKIDMPSTGKSREFDKYVGKFDKYAEEIKDYQGKELQKLRKEIFLYWVSGRVCELCGCCCCFFGYLIKKIVFSD